MMTGEIADPNTIITRGELLKVLDQTYEQLIDALETMKRDDPPSDIKEMHVAARTVALEIVEALYLNFGGRME
jgi:hypothetical protein